MTAPRQIDPRLAEQAAEWVERLTRDSSQACNDELADWLLRSPNHIDEFLVAKLTYSLFQNVDPQRQLDVEELIKNASRQVVQLHDVSPGLEGSASAVEEISQSVGETLPPAVMARSESRYRLRAWLATAAVVIVAIGGVLLYQLNANTYSTGLGEQRTVRLTDGSFIELNTRSTVRVRFSKDVRSVQLIEGEALFKVAHDSARPFRVSTRAATIQAVGTQFDVYLASGSDTRVTVVEGRVQVIGDPNPPKELGPLPNAPSANINTTRPAPSAPLILLAAGEQASVSLQGHIVKDIQPDVSKAVAWRNGRLIFHDAPVGEVIKEFGRYSDFRFSLVGDGLAQRRISGVFHADDPQTLVSLFEGDQTVEVTRTDNGVVVKLRP